jgi:hypothetical protein
MKSFNLGKSKTEQRFRSLFTRNVFTDYLEIDPNNNNETEHFNKGKSFTNLDNQTFDNKSIGINANNGNINNVNAVYLSGTLTGSNAANINTINFTGRITDEPPFGTIYAVNDAFYFVKDRPLRQQPSTNVNANDADNNICIASLTEDMLTLRGGIKTYGGLDVSGNISIDGTLSVSGATTLNDTLCVEKAMQLNDTLTVEKATTLKNELVVNGATTLNDTLSVAGIITNTDLTNRLNAKADKASHTNNTNIFTKITYNNQGIVIAGAGLAASDIPALEISKINNLQTTLNNKADKSTIYTKTETYTKSEVNDLIDSSSFMPPMPTYDSTNSVAGVSGNESASVELSRGWYRVVLSGGGGGGGGGRRAGDANGKGGMGGSGGYLDIKFYMFSSAVIRIMSGAGGICGRGGGNTGGGDGGGAGYIYTNTAYKDYNGSNGYAGTTAAGGSTDSGRGGRGGGSIGSTIYGGGDIAGGNRGTNGVGGGGGGGGSSACIIPEVFSIFESYVVFVAGGGGGGSGGGGGGGGSNGNGGRSGRNNMNNIDGDGASGGSGGNNSNGGDGDDGYVRIYGY